jgi:hypothetical protein
MRKATPSPGPNRRHARSDVPNVQSIHRVPPNKELQRAPSAAPPRGQASRGLDAGSDKGGDEYGDK